MGEVTTPTIASGDEDEKKEGWYALDLSNMGLISVCKEIRYYPHITALYLNNNRLCHFPEEICSELKSLTTLDVSMNQLIKLPSSLSQLSNLERLLIQQNQISELPLELGKLFRMKEIVVDGNPLTLPPKEIIKLGTESIISYLRDRMPIGPPPPERRFISYLESNFTIQEKDKFRVMTYNILSQSYANFELYFYCPSWALNWEYRKKLILKEILSYDCEIICLQEVEAIQYQTFFEPEMNLNGFKGIYAPKSRARTMEDWSNVDGCAIFFKESKFTLVEDHVLEYQAISLSRYKEFNEDPEAFSRLMIKDNIAIVAILQMKETAQNETPHQRSTKTWVKKSQSYVLVANTHIHWNPEFSDVKLMQVQMLLNELALLTAPKTKWHKIPMIISGDFNSVVSSGPYELMNSGSVGPWHSDLKPYRFGAFTSQGIKHSFNLSSAYAPIGEPLFTNYTGDFVGVLDYIFYTQDNLGVSKVLQPIDEEVIKSTRLPNPYFPSDHVSLLSEFFLKKNYMYIQTK